MIEKKYKVYLLTFPNGKHYCGFTSKPLKRRWDNGNGYKKCPLVWKAIQKYGWENVKKECIFSCDDEQEALDKEKETIFNMNLTNSDYGYNLHPGGAPIGGAVFLTEEGRKRISETHKKLWANPEYRARMMKLMKDNKPSPQCIEASKKATSLRRKGVTPSNARKVLQLDKNTGEIINEFISASHASEAMIGEKSGCTNILKVCKKQRKTAYNYGWRFKDE